MSKFVNYVEDIYKKVEKVFIPRKHSEKENPFTYVPISNIILRADTAIVKETGEVVKLTSDLKIAYTYMRDRYAYSKAAGNNYYESWESVATILGKNKAIFKNKGKGEPALHEQLQLLGLLIIDGTKTGRSNNKIILDVSDVLDKVYFINQADEDLTACKTKKGEFIPQSKAENTTNNFDSLPPTYLQELPPLDVYEEDHQGYDFTDDYSCPMCGRESGCDCIPF